MLFFKNPQKDNLLSDISLEALSKFSPPHDLTLEEEAGFCVIKNMFLIQDAYERGHLLYISDYLENHSIAHLSQLVGQERLSDAFYLQHFYNPDYFELEMLDSYGAQGLFARLKEDINATDAMMSLISEKTNFSDCRSMMMFARLLTLWDLCVAQKGQENGNLYFNQMFGQKNAKTPREQRLLISPLAEFSGLKKPANATKKEGLPFPINPFALFTGLDTNRPLEETQEYKLNVADVVFFANHQDYFKKHRGGEWAGFEMICCGEHGFMGFGLEKGKRFLKADEVHQLFMKSYNADVSAYEARYMRGLKISQLVCPKTIRLEEIPGRIGAIPRVFRGLCLHSLMLLDAPSISEFIRQYVQTPTKSVLMALKAAITEKMKPVQSSTDGLFAPATYCPVKDFKKLRLSTPSPDTSDSSEDKKITRSRSATW